MWQWLIIQLFFLEDKQRMALDIYGNGVFFYCILNEHFANFFSSIPHNYQLSLDSINGEKVFSVI